MRHRELAMKAFDQAAVRLVGRWLLLLLAYMLAAQTVIAAFMNNYGFRGDDERYGFQAMISGTAHRPFVYRVLMPVLVNAASALVPTPVQERLVAAARDKLVEHELVHGGDSQLAFKKLCTYMVLFVTLMLLPVGLRALAQVAYGPSLLADLSPPIAMLFLPLACSEGAYMYDFPEILLATWCLILLARGRLAPYYAVFILALLNKESSALWLAFFIAFYSSRMARRKVLVHLVMQVGLAVLISAAVRWNFRDNPGGPVEVHLIANLRAFAGLLPFIDLGDPYAPFLPAPEGVNIVVLFLIAFLCLSWWGEKPQEFRRALSYLFVAILPLWLLFGFRGEIRVFFPLFPVVYILALHTLSRSDTPRVHAHVERRD